LTFLLAVKADGNKLFSKTLTEQTHPQYDILGWQTWGFLALKGRNISAEGVSPNVKIPNSTALKGRNISAKTYIIVNLYLALSGLYSICFIFSQGFTLC